jgi:hypothetical protein
MLHIHSTSFAASVATMHICPSAGKHNNGLQLPRPPNSSSTHDSHITTCRASGVQAMTMGSITVSVKDNRSVLATVGKLVVHGSLRTDCSVPMHTMHQASATYIIKRPGNQPLVSRWVAGRVLSSDAELFAIRSAVVRATMLDNCNHIIVFTDSLTSARRPVDPSVHSGQAHSLTVCRTLNEWLAASADNHIEFIQTPSKLEWDIHHEAHLHACSLPPIPLGRRPIAS